MSHSEFDAFKARALADPEVRKAYIEAKVRAAREGDESGDEAGGGFPGGLSRN